MTRMPEFERDALRADRRRFATEERQVTRMERCEQAAKPWIGELCPGARWGDQVAGATTPPAPEHLRVGRDGGTPRRDMIMATETIELRQGGNGVFKSRTVDVASITATEVHPAG